MFKPTTSLMRRGEPSVCKHKSTRQTKLCDFNRLRGATGTLKKGRTKGLLVLTLLLLSTYETSQRFTPIRRPDLDCGRNKVNSHIRP